MWEGRRNGLDGCHGKGCGWYGMRVGGTLWGKIENVKMEGWGRSRDEYGRERVRTGEVIWEGCGRERMIAGWLKKV